MAFELHVAEPLAATSRLARAPWRRDAWTPEEVSLALHARRAAYRREMAMLPSARGVDSTTLDEIVDDASCAVVMKPRQIRDEDHLRRAFWFSVHILLARHHEGRGRLRVGSQQRTDFESVEQTVASDQLTVVQAIEIKDRLARAADFMAQLDVLERRVIAHMAIRGVGIKLASRELGLPLNRVKAAAHSAEVKLEQVAAISAAGRMCAYREPAIIAHASQLARPDQVRVAQAHISACSRCRKSYVQLVREMRRREFRRQASAAFLPPSMLVANHTGVLSRAVAFVNTHTPGNGLPSTNIGVRERALGLVGSGAGAAKAAGILAGATLIVAGANTLPSSAPHSHRTRHRSTRTKLSERQVAKPRAEAPPFRVKRSEAKRPAVPGSRPALRAGGFSYLGGNTASRTKHAAVAASPGKATSLNYLGGNAEPRSTPTGATAVSARSTTSTSTTSEGGRFSP